ncbi:MAG: tRNA pseudouridine synthase A [Acidobacteriaceae bacterium]
MNNWKLTLAYDGTDYSGWQVQPGRASIQGALADAIASLTGERLLPQGSGRTDAGVHALGQVASFRLAAAIPPGNLQRALNRILPAAIRVRTAEHVPSEFHARHSARGKIYQYRIFTGTVCPPFLARYVTCWQRPLDVDAMQRASARVLGMHDFTSFAASDPDRAARMAAVASRQRGEMLAISEPAGRDRSHAFTTRTMEGNVRRIDVSQWSRTPISSSTLLLPEEMPPEEAAEGGQLLTYTVRGDGFLHHMVRNLVGTFLLVGEGRIAPDAVSEILQARDRALAGPTAAPSGLYLMKVLYGGEVETEAMPQGSRFAP